MLEELTDKEKEQLERNKRYWGDRAAASQQKLTAQGVKRAELQLQSYYSKAMVNCFGRFEKTYNKILATTEEGRTPTPADLYKLDTYWKMQAQLKQELLKLGNRQIALMSDSFTTHYMEIYKALALPGDLFNEVDTATAQQMIRHIWAADGKTWSDRVWTNINTLQNTLNDGLLDCVITGKNTTQLKNILQERFNVSYNNADSIVRTEMAHIQTEAAKQRYMDAGIDMVEILADKDERRCKICGKLHKTRYPVGAQVPIPAHPRCRCCIVPVVD